MGARGPIAKDINWNDADELIGFQCTQEEVASFFKMSVDSLEKSCLRQNGQKLTDYWPKKKAIGRVKLRKLQFQIIEKMGPGATAMAIYLDKKLFPEERVYDFEIPRQIRDVTPQKLKFETFCANAGYPPPFPAQIGMMEFSITVDDPRMLLGARGYGKTDYVTALGVAYDVYCAWFDKGSTSNLIISKSRTRNTAIIQEIAESLEKNGVPLEKKNSACIRVQGHQGKDHSVEVLTIKSSFRGRHPIRIIMDDPVTEEDTSEAMRTLVKKKYDEAYKLCKNIVIIGQPAHQFDLYAELRDSLKLLEVPHGTIPELDADLEAMKLAGVDQHSIEMSYHLRIPKEGSSIFGNIKYIDRLPVKESVAFIDPSEGGDFTAISVVTTYMDGVAVEGKIWKKAWYHCLDEMVPFILDRCVKKLAFETNAHGNQPISQLRELLGPRGVGVVGKSSNSNKHACIVSAGSYSHLIHLSKGSDKAYTDQVVKYEYSSKNDDAPDSLARCLEWIGLIRSK